ncbi:diguanylate cyclase [Pseudomonas sp. RIT-PI-S]|uniref:GGDEF domain-containing protein n=1 Tax=Pseudomonas sp. RIT-PI-S TaxID=3035295 RepID=UPI0021D92607|nr:diguanylate cyclase [Pseudomonas sp. RIT-PI-S]
MSNPNLSILLAANDTRLCQSAAALLSQGGYGDVRLSSMEGALAELDQRPANLLLTSGDEGLALAARVRLLDEATESHTWILLVDSRSSAELLDETADLGVDDLLPPALVEAQLLVRVHAGDRLYSMFQRLGRENRLLRDNIASLEQRNLVDPLTGLGNGRYLRQKLDDSLRQIQARGGALCYLLIGLQNAEALQREYGEGFYDELLQGVGRRLQQMVRPLDVLARVDEHHFVLLTLPRSLQECAPSSFKRLHDGLNLKGFMTSAGLVDLRAGISLVGLDEKSLPVEPLSLFGEASRLLQESYSSGLVNARRLPAKA